MKPYLVLLCLLWAFNCLAQTPGEIEADLLKSFKKIDDNNQENGKANEQFATKLLDYTAKFPATITQDFPTLKAAYLGINDSPDGMFRVYSWDTWTGGTMHFFENVFQFKSGNETFSVLDNQKKEGEGSANYRKIYMLKANNQVYYLCNYITIGSTKDAGEGIQVFTIENGHLNDDVKIIKTKTGMHSKIYYNYNFFSVADKKVKPTIYFDSASQTIFLPVVVGDGKVTHNLIAYKFTGQYFEKVKN